MAGSSLDYKSLEFGLLRFSKELQNMNVEHFVFFGTLLGLTRAGKPIKGDDDVDFYVNKNDYQAVCKLLVSLGISLDYSKFPNHTEHFIQAKGIIDVTY